MVNCKKGKRCGRACIPNKRICRKGTQKNKITRYLKKKNQKYDPIEVDLSINLITHTSLQGAERVKVNHNCATMLRKMLPLINGYYKQAGIVFRMKQCEKTPSEISEIDQHHIGGDVDDIRNIEKLFEKGPYLDSKSVNVFVVPIIGSRTNAYQVGNGARSFIVMSTHIPEGRNLERSPANFANILSHEIGHELGYRTHTRDRNNLMSPYSPHGKKLTERQIKGMRKKAEGYEKRSMAFRSLGPRSDREKYEDVTYD